MKSVDEFASKFIHKSVKTGGSLEYIMAVFAMTFNNETVVYLYALTLLILPCSLKNFVLCFFLPSFGLLVTYILKRLICRARPALYIPRCKALVFDFRGKEKNHSMPSGDSLQAATFWFMLWYFDKVPLFISLCMASCTMISRVYYMCHYPTDTFFGAIMGILNFFFINSLLNLISFH